MHRRRKQGSEFRVTQTGKIFSNFEKWKSLASVFQKMFYLMVHLLVASKHCKLTFISSNPGVEMEKLKRKMDLWSTSFPSSWKIEHRCSVTASGRGNACPGKPGQFLSNCGKWEKKTNIFERLELCWKITSRSSPWLDTDSLEGLCTQSNTRRVVSAIISPKEQHWFNSLVPSIFQLFRLISPRCESGWCLWYHANANARLSGIDWGSFFIPGGEVIMMVRIMGGNNC